MPRATIEITGLFGIPAFNIAIEASAANHPKQLRIGRIRH
jgi:hypothetical protein